MNLPEPPLRVLAYRWMNQKPEQADWYEWKASDPDLFCGRTGWAIDDDVYPCNLTVIPHDKNDPEAEKIIRDAKEEG